MMLLIVFLLFILLFVPISIRIIRDNDYNDIDIYLFSFIRHKFDLDNFIRKFIVDEKKNNVSLKTIINNIEITLNSKKIIKEICSKTKIEKCTIVLKDNYDDTFKFIAFWSIVSRISYILKKYFKEIKNEYYMISNSDNELNVEIILKLNLWRLIFIFLKNIKEIKLINKIKRRQKNDGTSNL